MPLESASFVSGLVAANPPSGDLTSQGDDHLRLIKSVLLSTFPNAAKAFYFPDHAAKTGNYTILAADQNKIFSGDATAGAITFTLPVVGISAGFTVIVVKSDASANLVKLVPASGNISGAAEIALSSQYASAIAIWNGSSWIGLRFVTSIIDGDISFVGEVTFEDVVIFEQGVEFQGPLDIEGASVFDASATFQKPVIKTATVLADASPIVWDLATGADFKVTITSNRVLQAFTNGVVGQQGLLTVIQDGTGGWSLDVTTAGVYDCYGPSVDPIGRAANAQTVYEYEVIASNLMRLTRRGSTSMGQGARDLLDVKVAAASSSLDFVLTPWLQLYDRFEIDFEDLQASTDGAALNFRTSSNAGSSYDSGGSDYIWGHIRIHSSSDVLASSAAALISLIQGGDGVAMSNVSGETACGRITLYNPRAAQLFKMNFTATWIGQTYNMVHAYGGGVRNTAADVDAVRLIPSAGNLSSGRALLYGVGRR